MLLNSSTTRDQGFVKSFPGNAVYTVLLSDVGKVIDDAIVFHLDDNAKSNFKAEWLICQVLVSVSNIFKNKQKKNLNIFYDEGLVAY